MTVIANILQLWKQLGEAFPCFYLWWVPSEVCSKEQNYGLKCRDNLGTLNTNAYVVFQVCHECALSAFFIHSYPSPLMKIILLRKCLHSHCKLVLMGISFTSSECPAFPFESRILSWMAPRWTHQGHLCTWSLALQVWAQTKLESDWNGACCKEISTIWQNLYASHK